MTHDFKKGDPVILEDGRAGILKNVLVCIAEVEVDRHYKYVDVKTLRHNTEWDNYVKNSDIPAIAKQWQERESRAGESVAELETLVQAPYVGKWVDWKPSDPWPDKPNGQAEYEKIMADGCDPAPIDYSEFTNFSDGFDWSGAHGHKLIDPADDGPEVEILRSKP